MRMILIAFLVDAAVYALVAALVVWIGKSWLPAPWGNPSITIPLVVAVGLMLSLATFPHWLMNPAK